MRLASGEGRGVDGEQLYHAFASGLIDVQRKQDYLNRINVFPVPDGDTGTNVVVTLSYALEVARVSESAGETLSSIADAALVGARGNSGIIFAQFLGGLSEALRDATHVPAERFAEAAELAGRRAGEAVTDPKDGTILSVMRAWAEALRREAGAADSVGVLLRRASPALRESLEQTRETLAELRAAGVVDAGASGFVEFVTGAERFLDGGVPAPPPLPSHAGAEPSLGDELDRHESGGVHFRYCTEALLSGDAIDRDALRRTLEPFGDSLIVAGGAERVRVHIHTDDPASAFGALTASGRVVQQKVDDMRLQYEVAHERKYPIALVTDSVCDLPRELLDRYQIHVVPLHLRIDEREYLDGLTIEPALFFELAERARRFPSSSQPSGELFARLYSYLSTYYDSVIAIHTSGQLSGTAAASARAAAALSEADRISVVDSRHLSASLGLIVLRAAEAVEAGKSREEIVRELDRYKRNAEILVSVRTLRYMVRGGRVKPVAGLAGKVLNLKPIVSLDDEGKSVLYGKAFSVRRNVEKIVEMVARRHAETPLRCYAVVHGHDLEAATDLAGRLERALGSPPLFVEEISAIVALNAGRGAVAVATMAE
ncbi:MAG TPA: DegV family protein [Gaiellaceae bacterium]|nr:DegV family protein [Gaiellaceae bacterium]